jgi:hypothetical protein
LKFWLSLLTFPGILLFSALVGVWCIHRFFAKKREETNKKKKKKKGGVDLKVRPKYLAEKLSSFNTADC